MLARNHLVALLEILKYRLTSVERHAGSRIGERNHERACFAHDAQPDTAAFGKLHRVAKKIEQNLAQARRIADRLARNIQRDEARDFEPLAMRARREQLNNAFDKRRDGEARV